MANQHSHSEEELISLLLERSEQAFSIIYDAYSPVLYGIVLKIVRSEEVAEDVLQESFVKIWQGVDKFDRSRGSLFTWLLNITRNHAIDYIRSKYARHQVSEDRNSVSIDAEESFELPVDTIGMKELIDTMAPEYKILIDMMYFKGYTQKELSDELHIPLGTIKTRVRAAFNQLRILLKDFKYE